MKILKKNNNDILLSYYDEKIEKLLLLLEKQKEQIRFLDYGNGLEASRIAASNKKLVVSLQQLDLKIEKIEESLPGSSAVIEKTDHIFSLIDQARRNHEIIEPGMEKCLADMKQDLNQIEIKRQLHTFLHVQQGC